MARQPTPLITVNELRSLMPQLGLVSAAVLQKHLEAAMRKHGIISRGQRCAFLSNLAHESQQLTRWEENLKYSAKRLREVFPKYFPTAAKAADYAGKPQAIANCVYGGRMGNRLDDDGWRYRGRGPIGLTGRENYRRLGDLVGIDLEQSPDLAAQPDVGCMVAAAFWKAAGCNELADLLTFTDRKRDRITLTRICLRINGGHNGLEDRLAYFNRAKVALQLSKDDEPQPAAPAAALEAETVAQQEAAAPEVDEDLMTAALRSDKAKAVGVKLWPRLVRHFTFALGWTEAMYQAHKFGAVVVALLILAVVAWVIYHNRKALNTWCRARLK